MQLCYRRIANSGIHTIQSKHFGPGPMNPGLGSRKASFRTFLRACTDKNYKDILAGRRASPTSMLQAILPRCSVLVVGTQDSWERIAYRRFALYHKCVRISNIHLTPDLAGIRNYDILTRTAEKSALLNRSHFPASHPASAITKLLALVSNARLYDM